jgi:hypothetical protein
MDILNPNAASYSLFHSSETDHLLQLIETETMQNHAHSHMLSGCVQGKFLEMICRMIHPFNVLEIGTFTGYSAICLSKGLHEGGKVHTIEIREADALKAVSYYEQAGLENKICQHIGCAKDILPKLQEKWYLVFIDADKVSYIDYYELTLPNIKSGGWMLADNVLFHGQVLEEQIKGKNALAMEAFNKHVLADNRVEQVLLTIRDGITLIRKL